MIHKQFVRFRLIFLLFLTLLVGSIKGQQDPMFTQYMFNQLAVNPAYAGSREMLSIMLLARQQWVGFEGAPFTGTFTGHVPLYQNMAIGSSIIYDSYGPVNQTSFYIDYAYHLKMNNKTKLSLGLKGGFSNYSVDYSKLSRTTYIDDAYALGTEQITLPNFGFGAYLYSQKYYVGVSVPRLLENDYNEDNNIGGGKEVRHYYGMAGMVFILNENFALRPSVMTRFAQGSPFNIDANINTILYDKLWLGAMYRLGESFGGIVQFQFSPQVKLGYAFDLNTNQLKSYNSGTHEVMLNYEFSFNKDKVVNPRYF